MKPTTEGIAIVGMACRYPDATNPQELWENVLAKRQAFRRLPPERLNLSDYGGAKGGDPDSTYATCAAVLTDWEFDRAAFKVSGAAFRAADLTHWLALEVATKALADAGFCHGAGLPQDATGAVVGNTLTGEFARAGLMRLRWPYVRRVVGESLSREGRTSEEIGAFLAQLEQEYKAPFPAMNEESLAGGLSNTIAGRICNHFDLHGGGYTVDGACASSLLAVTTACSGLLTGDLDVALAGGVDLSLDPFELVGFSRAGALATDEMRVYDEHSAGFWPGEGCGFVVLMRTEDAEKQGRRIYARICGWGISSDGSGGITRPEVEGQLLALRRAYGRAGFGAGTVGYFEGHGTGTSVGDATEITALGRARRESDPDARPAAIGSIKANIGHTKAAAGVAGLIKAALALQNETLPPNTGCDRPHGLLSGDSPTLRIVHEAEYWQNGTPRRAGVSAMGFGGINTHIALEEVKHPPNAKAVTRRYVHSTQDTELFLLTAESISRLQERIAHLLTIAPDLSLAEIADAAASLIDSVVTAHPVRAAVLADRPDTLTRGLTTLLNRLRAGETTILDVKSGIFLGKTATDTPRIGLLFPGQGTTSHADGGWLCRRFDVARETFARSPLPQCHDVARDTAYAQPAIVAAEMAGVYALESLGIRGIAAIGHSLGELAALCWAGAICLPDLLSVATARGRAMANLGANEGAMASLATDAGTVESMLNGTDVRIAALNAPRQTVVSGSVEAVHTVTERARSQGIGARLLPVAFAFHSPLVAPAIPPLLAALETITPKPVERRVYSTITGNRLPEDADLCHLLSRQVTGPVRFLDALGCADPEIELWIEVGPGSVLSGLLSAITETPAIAIDATGSSARGFLTAVGASFVMGATVEATRLFATRFIRPFHWDTRPSFLANPCEAGGRARCLGSGDGKERTGEARGATPTDRQPDAPCSTPHASSLETVRAVIMEKAEFSREMVTDSSRMLSDLHLNSLLVSQIVVEAARRFGVSPPVAPTEAADATVAEIAATLVEGRGRDTGGQSQTGCNSEPVGMFPGTEAWVREYTVEWVEMPLPEAQQTHRTTGDWQIFAPEGCPLAEPLSTSLPGSGIAICLPSGTENDLPLLLSAAKTSIATGKRMLLVQEQPGTAAFVRSLHLECPEIPVTVITLPLKTNEAVTWIACEVAAHPDGFVEVRYSDAGQRHVPILRLLPLYGSLQSPGLRTPATLLVTGGGKGITAECALALARKTGAKLALLGRSDPAADAKLAANLERMAADVTVRYYHADVTDADAVRGAIRRAEAEMGPITGVLHGAGTNIPARLQDLTDDAFRNTLAPKIEGLRNVLAALDTDSLELLVTFGSIIGRLGFRGNADYATANERLTLWTEEFAAAHPGCLCRALEWSVWSGVGMGERLGAVDALVREGIQPISVDEGVSRFLDLLDRPLSSPSVVVTGRFGNAPTVRLSETTGGPPHMRFLETVHAHYPGLELVADAEISRATDLYLSDHAYQGEPLLPAVLGMEAMAQAAMAVVGTNTLPDFTDVSFRERIPVLGDEPVTIRVIALVQSNSTVKVALRSSYTGFATEHFSAVCHFDTVNGEPGMRTMPGPALAPSDPHLVQNLYDTLLFHGPSFQRVEGYARLEATECVAEISVKRNLSPFAPQLPAALYLGDPGTRDAALHAVQATLPQKTLLPVRVESVTFFGAAEPSSRQWVWAKEIARDGDRFTYDLDIADEHGQIIERWRGLTYRALGEVRERLVPAGALLGPYLERIWDAHLPHYPLSIAVEVGASGEARRERSNRAIHRALGSETPTFRRPDGKPEVAGSGISASHSGNLTIAVAARGTVACDLEVVTARSEGEWRDLLGQERFLLAESLARANREDRNTAATRIWTVAESLVKAGTTPGAPLAWDTVDGGNSVLFTAGNRHIVSVLLPTPEGENRWIAALLTEAKEKAYEYRHVVSFEETNVVGNVYYTNHLLWQGRCREMFLREHCPEVLEELKNGLALVTLNVCCRYLSELTAFDEVVVRMTLASLGESEMSLRFDFLRAGSGEVIARGEQQLGCMRRTGDRLIPTRVPLALKRALADYQTGPEFRNPPLTISAADCQSAERGL